MANKGMTLFEVETIYKSGRKRVDIIEAECEKDMWQYYDKHHRKDRIASSVIVDAWGQ